MKLNSFQNQSIPFFRSFVISVGALVITLFMFLPVHAETKLELDETEITGARELPKVLYIVPWKKTQPGGHSLPMRSLIDEALSPIDVDVFKRQVRYHELTQPSAHATEE